jgi:hypothetical protein
MSVHRFRRAKTPRAAAAAALLGFSVAISGCAQMGETMSSAFVDPARYDLYDCKQLETERKSQATRAAELQGLMAKAETGVAGSVVAEVAYRNDYISVRAQQKLAEEAWQRNKCREKVPDTPITAVPPAPAASAKRAPSSKR